jgi:rfaE bifunctional protein nucleotidyltransferase chain/domain
MQFDQKTLSEIQLQKSSGKRIVFTNGCFDLLHVGHVRYLAEAKALGDLLVVGLNSDSSVKILKGSERPIVPEQERKEMLLALKSVDYVCLFDQEIPLELITEVKPDFLVKGGDWKKEQIVGYEFVESIGGEVRSLQFFPGNSSTDLLNKVKSL